jgi:Uma2 family endonuclease
MIATVRTIGPADAGLELTREEFAEAEFTQGHRYERFEGKLVAMPPPGEPHHFTVEPFRTLLGTYSLARPDVVEHVLQDSWIQVNGATDRIPDIAVYLRSTKEPPPLAERVPELIFEIVSPGWENRCRDYQEKRAEYERLGVLEYVIVDRHDQRVTVLRLVERKYQE